MFYRATFRTSALMSLLLASMLLASSPAFVLGQDGSPVAADLDGDGVADEFDACRDIPDPDQLDSDGDWLGDACDPTPNGDSDGDGVDEWSDACPGFDDAVDLDGNGVPDGCDTLPIPASETPMLADVGAEELAGNTPVGDWISVELDGGFRVIFESVIETGTTSAISLNMAELPALPNSNLQGPGPVVTISSTASWAGQLYVCGPFDRSLVKNLYDSSLYRLDGGAWVEVGHGLDENLYLVCGTSDALGTFSVGHPPLIEPTPEGNTRVGEGVEPYLNHAFQVRFDSVTVGGQTTAVDLDPASLPPLPEGFVADSIAAAEITTTASWDGSIYVCGPFDAQYKGKLAIYSMLQLREGVWVEIGGGLDEDFMAICGYADSLGIFATARVRYEGETPMVTVDPVSTATGTATSSTTATVTDTATPTNTVTLAPSFTPSPSPLPSETATSSATGSATSTPTAASAALYVTTASVNLRSGPGTSFSILAVVRAGAVVTQNGNPVSNGGYVWYPVDVPGIGHGWIARTYLKPQPATTSTSTASATASRTSTPTRTVTRTRTPSVTPGGPTLTPVSPWPIGAELIVTDRARLLTAPGGNPNGTKWIESGTRVVVTGNPVAQPGRLWYPVATTGSGGWIEAGMLQTAPPASPTVTLTATRSWPGFPYGAVLTVTTASRLAPSAGRSRTQDPILPPGSTVIVIGEPKSANGNHWYPVMAGAGSGTGWVRARDLQFGPIVTATGTPATATVTPSRVPGSIGIGERIMVSKPNSSPDSAKPKAADPSLLDAPSLDALVIMSVPAGTTGYVTGPVVQVGKQRFYPVTLDGGPSGYLKGTSLERIPASKTVTATKTPQPTRTPQRLPTATRTPTLLSGKVRPGDIVTADRLPATLYAAPDNTAAATGQLVMGQLAVVTGYAIAVKSGQHTLHFYPVQVDGYPLAYAVAGAVVLASHSQTMRMTQTPIRSATATSTPPAQQWTTGPVHLRNGASTQYSIVAVLLKGTSVTLTGAWKLDGAVMWRQVRTTLGQLGWLPSAYLTATPPV